MAKTEQKRAKKRKYVRLKNILRRPAFPFVPYRQKARWPTFAFFGRPWYADDARYYVLSGRWAYIHNGSYRKLAMGGRPSTTLVMPKDLLLAARKKALDEGTSVSAVVRAFLRAWLDGRLQPPDEEHDERGE